MQDAPGAQPPPAVGRIRWLAFERHPALARVRGFLDQDVARPFTLTIAAQVAGLNPKYFSALFHARIGVRFIDWLHFVRTQRAKEMLERTNRPIAEIAVSVGYKDLRTFERAFKKCNGQTAQQHRRVRAATLRKATLAAPAPAPPRLPLQ